jgi:CRISPR locus-related DNA-binding protein
VAHKISKALVFTLGFDVTHVLTRLTEIGLEGKEKLIFVLPKDKKERAEASVSAIQAHINALNSRGFKLSGEFLRVDEHDFLKAVRELYQALEGFDELFVELSGGLRILNFALFTASLLLGEKVKRMSTKLETDGSNVALTQLPLVTLKQNEKALLQALKGEKTISELSKEVKRNKTSVYRTLEQLEEKGLVKPSETHPVRYSITALGELILDSQKWLNHGRE